MQLFDQLRLLLTTMGPRLRRRWLSTIPLTLLSAIAEGGGAVLIFWVIQTLTLPDGDSVSRLGAGLLAFLPVDDGRGATVLLLASLALVFLVKNVILGVAVYWQGLIVCEANVELSARLIKHYLTMPYERHTRRGSPDLLRNMLSSIHQACGAASAAMGLVSNLLLALAILIVLAVASPAATLGVAAFLSAVLFLVVFFTRRIFRLWGRDSRTLSGLVIKALQQIFEGIREIKLFGREAEFFEDYMVSKRRHARISHLNDAFGVVPRLVSESVFVCAGLAAIAAAVWFDGSTDRLAIISLYAYAGVRLLPLANGSVSRLNSMRFGLASVEHLHRDFEAMGTSQETPRREACAVLELHEGLRLDSLTYTYEGASAPTLEGLCISLPVNSSIAIVGQTGTGKSTLLNLVVGLLDLQGGGITLDGVPIARCMTQWQRTLGYVPQRITVLDDTLRRNVAFGLADAEIDEEHLWDVLRAAQLSDFVELLPDGVETTLGEHGVRLSGGERQRLGIARALYTRPAALFLDEVTAGVDRDTERRLMTALSNAPGLKLRVFVSHRRSTVDFCDYVAVLDAGKVEAFGTLAEIATKSETFRLLTGAYKQTDSAVDADESP